MLHLWSCYYIPPSFTSTQNWHPLTPKSASPALNPPKNHQSKISPRRPPRPVDPGPIRPPRRLLPLFPQELGELHPPPTDHVRAPVEVVEPPREVLVPADDQQRRLPRRPDVAAGRGLRPVQVRQGAAEAVVVFLPEAGLGTRRVSLPFSLHVVSMHHCGCQSLCLKWRTKGGPREGHPSSDG